MSVRVRIAALWLAVLAALAAAQRAGLPTEQSYWHGLAQRELEEALRVQPDTRRARSVILMVGDGMGPNTVTAARIATGGEGHRLAFEEFPHIGMLKTYSADKMVPDSASTATALFCGAKVNQQTVAVDASVPLGDCAASRRTESHLRSLAALALDAGMSAGLVTTMRVTHATPAPLYAHSAHRKWECDAAAPAACKDHARQLVEDWPGRDLQVIMGGGRQVLTANASGSAQDPLDTWSCRRTDGRDLVREYERNRRARGQKYSVVTNNRQLGELDVEGTDYLLGIFANGHLKYEYERDKGPDGMPSLTEMVEAAIKVLEKNKNGYFLMVEAGNIDMAHHRGRARVAVEETAELSRAAAAARRLAATDTLLVVASDHTHTLTINGYPYRGSDVFGVASQTPDGANYTTLSYGTGGPGTRRHEAGENTTSYEYQAVSAIELEENAHGGGDVLIYATGPHAHLFHSVHEQHYVHHALAYAAGLAERAAHTAHAASTAYAARAPYAALTTLATLATYSVFC